MPLRLLYFGTPAFAVPTLDALLASPHQVAAVVTQPDRPRGRGQKVQPPPVKARAIEAGVPVLQPTRLKDEETLAALARVGADAAVVAAYGKLLPQALLDLPRLGFLNVHASLLPRWRGAAPIHRAVIAGDRSTGVTIMRVVLALDAGPMLAAESIQIGDTETSAELEPRLAALGATLLVASLDRLERGDATETPQPEAGVTYAARLERRESQIDWHRDATTIHNQIRGLQPWPLASGLLHGKRVSLLRSAVADIATTHATPGAVIAVEPDALVIAAARGAVRVTEVQPEGRAAMSVRAFLNGRRVDAGDRVEPLPGS